MKKLPLNFLVGDLAELVTWVLHLIRVTEPGLLFGSPSSCFIAFFFFQAYSRSNLMRA